MAEAAAVIISAIVKLESWLLTQNDRAMLYSLLVEVADPWDYDKLYSFVVEVEDLWELNCREKLHTLLLEMMDPDIDPERLLSLAVEVADLWKHSKRKLNKEKLYTWLAKNTDFWEESKGKLNKEKLYTWLSNKTDLWEEDEYDDLFDLLEGMTLLDEHNERMGLLNEEVLEYVEGVRNDLRFILNKLEDEGSSHSHLHYFMSDVLEIAHDVQLLVHLKESDPIILFLLIQGNTRYLLGSILDLFLHIKPVHKWLQQKSVCGNSELIRRLM